MSADPSESREPIGWSLLHRAHGDRQRVSVCVAAAEVTHDQRGGAGPRQASDMVGFVVAFDGGHDGTVTLAGMSFTTVIRWADIRGAWLRDESPNPCICGRLYDREPRRPVAALDGGEHA